MKYSTRAPVFVSVSAAVSALLHPILVCADVVSSQPEDQLHEIIVTATRRAQSVSDVPYNITAVTGEDLQRLGIVDLDSFAHSVAGLANIDQGPRAAGNNNQLILRGLNADGARALDDNHRSVAPVSTYLGETPLFFNLKLFDMDRVEILRGPQGTIYGSGSLGGTVRFMPNHPQFGEFQGQGQVEVGSTDDASGANRDVQAMLNVPFGSEVALRVAGGKEHLGGFITETNLAVLDSSHTPEITGPILDPNTQLVRRTARHTDESDVVYARATLGLRFSPDITAELHYNYQRTNVGDRQADNTLFPGNGPYQASNSLLNPQTARADIVGLDVEADLGFATLTSATSWYETKEEAVESDGGIYQLFLASAYYFGYPRFVVPGRTQTEEHATTQEIRLTSKGDEKVDWLVGSYYAKQVKNYSLVDAPDNGLAAYVAALNPFQGSLGTATPSITGLDLFDQAFSEQFRDAALFGELTWHITDRWQVTGGARRFWQKDESSQDFGLPVCQQLTFCGPPQHLADSNTEDNQIFRANTSLKLDSHDNLYFTWAQGFRHGGANALPPPGTPQSDPNAPFTYRSDRSTNWEIGLKGTIPEVSLRYSVAAYYIKWKNFQFDSFTSLGFSFVGNGPQASSRGAELEISGDLGHRFSYSASYSYIDAKVDKTFSIVSTANKGDPLPGVPPNSASVGLDYNQSIREGLKLTYHVDGSYRDRAYSDFNASALSYFRIRPFTVWNAATTLAWGTGWDVRLFAQNIFSEKGRTGGSTPARLGDEAYFQVMRPLTVGVRLTRSF